MCCKQKRISRHQIFFLAVVVRLHLREVGAQTLVTIVMFFNRVLGGTVSLHQRGVCVWFTQHRHGVIGHAADTSVHVLVLVEVSMRLVRTHIANWTLMTMMLIPDKSIASAHPIVVNQYHLLHHRRRKYHEPSTCPELHQRNQREEGERCTR
jgi:hypothetical protein